MPFIFGLYSISANGGFKSDCAAAQTERNCHCFHCGISEFNIYTNIRTCGSNSIDSDQAAHVHGLIIGSVVHVCQSRLSSPLLCVYKQRGFIPIMTTQTSIYIHNVTNLWSANHGTVNAHVSCFSLMS